MADKQSNEIGSFLGGMLLGAMLGAPLAAWLSPRSGRETRRQIRQTGTAVVRKPAELVGAVQETVGSQIERVQDRVGQLRGETIEESLAEGKALAAERAGKLLSSGE